MPVLCFSGFAFPLVNQRDFIFLSFSHAKNAPP
jgi:hypothetical protein